MNDITLGFSDQQLRDIDKMNANSAGVVLFSGPTHARTTDTLLKMAEDFNLKDKNFDIAGGGEITDRASVHIALDAASHGHRVWNSIHAGDAIGTVLRLKQMMNDNSSLEHVSGVISQRLFSSLCSDCKVSLSRAIAPDSDITIDLGLVNALRQKFGEEKFDNIHVKSSAGCDHCTGGFSGRIAVAETLVPDHNYTQGVVSGDLSMSVEHWKNNLGGVSLLENAVLRMLKGEIDPRDIETDLGSISSLDSKRLSELSRPH